MEADALFTCVFVEHPYFERHNRREQYGVTCSWVSSLLPFVFDVLAPMETHETLTNHPLMEVLELLQKVGKEFKIVIKIKRGRTVVSILVY